MFYFKGLSAFDRWDYHLQRAMNRQLVVTKLNTENKLNFWQMQRFQSWYRLRPKINIKWHFPCPRLQAGTVMIQRGLCKVENPLSTMQWAILNGQSNTISRGFFQISICRITSMEVRKYKNLSLYCILFSIVLPMNIREVRLQWIVINSSITVTC